MSFNTSQNVNAHGFHYEPPHNGASTIARSWGTVPTERPISMSDHRELFELKFEKFLCCQRQFNASLLEDRLELSCAISMGSILAEYSNVVKPNPDSSYPLDEQTIYYQRRIADLHFRMKCSWDRIAEFLGSHRNIRARFGDGKDMGAGSEDETPDMRRWRHWAVANTNYHSAHSNSIKYYPPGSVPHLEASYSLALFLHSRGELKEPCRILREALRPTHDDAPYLLTESLDGFNRMKAESERLLGLAQLSHVPPPRKNGEFVPQREYMGQGCCIESSQRARVVFLLPDGSYPRVAAAARSDCPPDSLQIEQLLPNIGPSVRIRFEWPGYHSVSYELWIPEGSSVTKFAKRVAEFVETFIEDMNEVPIEPFHSKWKVGPGNIEAEHLLIISIEQVTLGNFQALLFLDRTSQTAVLPTT